MRKTKETHSHRGGVETVVNLLALVLFVILAVAFVAAAISTHFLTPVLIAALAAVVVVLLVMVWALRRSHRSGVRAAGSVLAMVFCLIFALGIGYIRVGMNALDRITTDQPQTVAMTIYVREGDNRTLKELMDTPWGTLSTDQANTQAALEQLEQDHGVALTPQAYPGATELVDALEQGQVEVILAAPSRLQVLENMADYASVFQGLREVETLQVAPTSSQPTGQSAPTVDQVFTVYISGNDTRSNDIDDTQRSDVNIIATINPKTHQVLLVSTPRDYFIPLSYTGGVRDKLTHAGGRGIEESMKSLEMLYDIKLDYYFKVNFAGFEGIINALGGIDVYSDYDFESFISDYTYQKGINHMDGEKALYFVRERYNLPKGDFQRGIHQMRMIEAVADKVLSPAILTQYLPFMDAVGNCFRTSIPSDFITDMVQNQLQNGGDWNIVSYYVSGTPAYRRTFSYPSYDLAVVIPDESTIEVAKDLMQRVYNGEIVTPPEN